jgi:hypothetical protein
MDGKELIKKAEIKRIGEQLTKRELCRLLDISYNFYWNCISGSNNPSQKMSDALESYIQMPTHSVYETIFAKRSKETKRGAVKTDEHGKEMFHESLNVTKKDVKTFLDDLASKNIYKEPKEYDIGK